MFNELTPKWVVYALAIEIFLIGILIGSLLQKAYGG